MQRLAITLKTSALVVILLIATGHSIGLDVHETGDVSSVNTDIVQEGMIFSIEPGIYLPVSSAFALKI